MYNSNSSGALLANKKTEMELSPKVLDLSLDELEQARRILNGEMMHYLGHLNHLLKNGYKMSKVEQNLLDKFIEEYQITYKSPLAQALQEE